MEKWFHPDWAEKVRMTHYSHHQVNINPGSNILPWPPNCYGSSSSSSLGNAENQITGDHIGASSNSSKSHSQSEKRRRERINAHLSTLRRIIPHSDKMDKASLLGSVVEHVKELKRKAVEIGQVLTIPSEFDQVTIVAENVEIVHEINNKDDGSNNTNDWVFFRAYVCCEDREDLLMDLIDALKGLKVRIVRAEMVTMGGRIVNILILGINNGSGGVCLSSVKKSLGAVLSRVASSPSSSSMNGFSRKRQRLLFPPQYY